MTCPICKFTAKWEVWGYEEEEQEDVYDSDDATADDKNKKL